MNGRLLVLGGLTNGSSTDAALEVDPTSGAIRQAGRLARAVHDAAGVVLGKTPVVFGGGASSTVATAQTFPPGGTGRIVGSLPQPRSDLVAAEVGGAAYILGGYTGVASVPGVLVTRDGSSFQRVADLPVPVRYPAVSVVRSSIYLFGGEQDGTATDVVQRVDTVSGTAQVVARLPMPLAHAAAATSGNRVVIAGGRSAGHILDQLMSFDPATGRTTMQGRLPYPVADAGVATSGSVLWLLGGEGHGRLSTVIRISL